MPTRRTLGKTSLALLAASMFGMPALTGSRKKILFDTDIGSDIDDAVALAYLLRQPMSELIGITTVTGEPRKRAQLAADLCQKAGIRVPIVAGASLPLEIPQRQTAAPQAEKLNREYALAGAFGAVEFMRGCIRQYPGEITLLAVGPLTNIAQLFKADPEIPGLLKEVILMAGKYSDYPTPWGPTEWNAIVDPHAADIVFRTDVPITAYGLDITWQVSMTPAEVRQRFIDEPLLETVHDWSEVWFRDRELLHFHDPLAAAALFDRSICGYKRGRISVELEPGPTQGVTHFTADATSPHQFANSVNASAFFSAYFSVFGR